MVTEIYRATHRIQKYGTHGTLGGIGMIAVIESLPDGDRKTGRLLREDIEVVALPYGNNLQIHYKTARSSDELQFLLEELSGYVSLTGRAPILHIECHGDVNGLELADKSRMSWAQLRPLLSSVNLASHMNVLLVLACCYGGYFATECHYQEHVPFAYILGLGNEIKPDPLFAFTGAFYAELLRTMDVTEALTVAGPVRPGITYFSMSAVGIFRKALTTPIKRVDSTETRAQIRDIGEPLFNQLRQQFFALDSFPENAVRFAITYAEVLAEVEEDAV